jgi:hypothetical protein
MTEPVLEEATDVVPRPKSAELVALAAQLVHDLLEPG